MEPLSFDAQVSSRTQLVVQSCLSSTICALLATISDFCSPDQTIYKLAAHFGQVEQFSAYNVPSGESTGLSLPSTPCMRVAECLLLPQTRLKDGSPIQRRTTPLVARQWTPAAGRSNGTIATIASVL